MTSQAQKTDRATPNEWGGLDWRGKVGLARTTVEDGETTVLFFSRYGQGDLLAWQARFSTATPAAVIAAAIEAARRLADGRPETFAAGDGRRATIPE